MTAQRNASAPLGRFDHGGDVRDLGDVVDFSASLNPLGMPVQVVRALKVAAGTFDVYPDPRCRELSAALAAHLETPEELVVPTAGATDAFSRIAAAAKPHKVLVCSPCYSGYEQSLRAVRPRIAHYSLVARENFDVTERILDYIEPELDMLVLCSPNNPTGRVLPRELLVKILREADRWGTRVVLDESFLPLTEEHSAVSLLDRYPNLVVVGSFTKVYAIAGLRLGWCAAGKPDFAATLREAGDPWAVSTPAQVAGLAALEVSGYLGLAREYVARERDRLEGSLRDLGMLVVPSAANFVLFQGRPGLYEDLLERGFVIRRCENFRGLDQSWYRVAVRTTADNKRLISALGDVAGRAR